MECVETVEVKRFEYSERWCIVGDDGDWFYNRQGEARTYSRPGSAVAFLRRTGYPWAVEMPSGKTVYVRCVDPSTATRMGPHEWYKANAVTIDGGGGYTYDVWRCRLCGEEVKRYGLSGCPPGGVCEENLQEKMEENQ